MSARVLIAGFATRHVAQSAFRAGYEVCAVDHFCDQDLSWYTKDRIRFDDLTDLPPAIEEMCGRYPFDLLVLTSGAEDLPARVPLCGTPPDRISRFLDKLSTQHFFEDLHIPVPPLCQKNEYPAMLKPLRGAGGWRNAVVSTPSEETAWESLYPGVPYLRQRVVAGTAASVCCITDGKRACAIASNEQILRDKDGAEFGFCGSVTPCSHPMAVSMVERAVQIASASGCTGTVGVDFVLGDSISAIEVNPRFQATVDTVEMATGCNMFTLHAGAVRGILPKSPPLPGLYAVRKILFADRDVTVREDLKSLSPLVADIPYPGTFFEEDQAIVSVFGQGRTRAGALEALDKNITTIRQYLR